MMLGGRVGKDNKIFQKIPAKPLDKQEVHYYNISRYIVILHDTSVIVVPGGQHV